MLVLRAGSVASSDPIGGRLPSRSEGLIINGQG